MGSLNTHKNGSIWISESPVTEDLDRAGFELLNWIKIALTGAIPDLGATESITAFDTLEGAAKKGKGNLNAGDPEITYILEHTDAGQIKMAEAGNSEICADYGFRFLLGDKTPGFTETVVYTRGIVASLRIIGGDGNTAILRGATLGLSQVPVEVHPQAT